MCSICQHEAYLELFQLAFFGQDIRLGPSSCRQQLPDTGHLGHNQLVTFNKVLGSRDEALKGANISFEKLLVVVSVSYCTEITKQKVDFEDVPFLQSPVICFSSAAAESAAAPCSWRQRSFHVAGCLSAPGRRQSPSARLCSAAARGAPAAGRFPPAVAEIKQEIFGFRGTGSGQRRSQA